MKKSLIALSLFITVTQYCAEEYENPNRLVKRTPQEMKELCASEGVNYRIKTPEEVKTECKNIKLYRSTPEQCEKEASRLVHKDRQSLRTIIPTERLKTPEELQKECDKVMKSVPQRSREETPAQKAERRSWCDKINKYVAKTPSEIDQDVEREMKKETSPQEQEEVCKLMEKKGKISAWRERTEAERWEILHKATLAFNAKREAERQAARNKAKAEGAEKKYKETIKTIDAQLASITASINIKDAAFNTSAAKVFFKKLIDEKLATRDMISARIQLMIKSLNAPIKSSASATTLSDVIVRYLQNIDAYVKTYGKTKKGQ